MNTLLVGYKAADMSPRLVEAGEVVCHTLDIYHRHAIEKVFHGKVRVICTPHLPLTAPDGSPWRLVRFKTGPKLMSGELALDLLQECHRLGCRVEVEYVGRERDRNDLLDKVKERTDRVFRAEWPASVPGGERQLFVSYPGCFCHRRLDEGGLSLAEVVTRELRAVKTPSANPIRLLDMGCGCGLVGLLIATFERAVSPVLVDSHSRAIEAATENAANFGVAAECILSDNGSPARMDESFDIFVGNPPYYSDYRIAEVFLETAKRALKVGGVCYQVVKNAANLEPVQRKYFNEVEIIHRRGYAVLKSVKA